MKNVPLKNDRNHHSLLLLLLQRLCTVNMSTLISNFIALQHTSRVNDSVKHRRRYVFSLEVLKGNKIGDEGATLEYKIEWMVKDTHSDSSGPMKNNTM